MSKRLLNIKKLNAGYGKSLIINEVSLHLDEGEIVSLIGPNGAGKSTVIKSIFNITKIHSGEILFNEESILGLSTYELVRKRLVYLNQGKVTFGNLTVRENLKIAGEVLFKKKEVDGKIEEILQLFDALKPKLDDLAFYLSGGQRQQLALARSLIQNPQVLLLDEPTLGLSPILQQDFFERIIALREKGISCLMVEQNTSKAVSLSNRTYLLENGKIVLEGGVDILNHPMIRKVYLGS